MATQFYKHWRALQRSSHSEEVMCPVKQRSTKGSKEVDFALSRARPNEFRVERQQNKHRCGVKNSKQLYFILHKSSNAQLSFKTNQFVLAPKLFA